MNDKDIEDMMPLFKDVMKEKPNVASAVQNLLGEGYREQVQNFLARVKQYLDIQKILANRAKKTKMAKTDNDVHI